MARPLHSTRRPHPTVTLSTTNHTNLCRTGFPRHGQTSSPIVASAEEEGLSPLCYQRAREARGARPNATKQQSRLAIRRRNHPS
eukprot:6911172-Alexandrium_andersonii.AAC.1